MGLIPDYFIFTIVFILGLIIGSFLDVLVSRFHTGKSINGRSHCTSCGHTLSWYELFPLLSYLILRGKCLACQSSIPKRLLLMELSTALLFLLVAMTSDTFITLGFGLVLMSVLIVVAAYDINHMVIPHVFVFIIGGLSLVGVLLTNYPALSLEALLPHAITAACVSSFFWSLWALSKGRWIGLGDAKLVLPLSFMLTPLYGFSLVVFSFWIGALLSVGYLLFQSFTFGGKHRLPITRIPLTMKSEVPFAPFMIAAFIVVYYLQFEVLSMLTGLL